MLFLLKERMTISMVMKRKKNDKLFKEQNLVLCLGTI